MDERIFPACTPEDPTAFAETVETLLGGRADLVWVDNSVANDRAWGLYPVYLSAGRVRHDAILPLGDYFLILYAGDQVTEEGDTLTIRGGYSYGRGGYCHEGDTVQVDENGVCTFGAEADTPEQLGLGLCYAVRDYHAQTRRHIVRTISTPVFCFPARTALDVTYFPSLSGQNQLRLREEGVFQTHFSTIFAASMSLHLPVGFAFQPAVRPDVNGYAQVYFTPSGTALATSQGRLMLGLSGAEYVSLEEGDPVAFRPGGSAWFEPEPLSCKPTTAYLSFPSSLYHTQPQDANFYAPSDGGTYLFAELPGVLAGAADLPVFPYSGGTYDGVSARRLEESFLVPVRREAVGAVVRPAQMHTGQAVRAVTRHGMTASVDGDELQWLRLASTGAAGPDLAFTQPDSTLQLSLLANRLFLAMGDLGNRAGTPFTVDEARLLRAERHGCPDTEKLRALLGRDYLSQTDFSAAIAEVGAATSKGLLDACDCFNVDLAGWCFQLSPRLWKENGALLVEKLDGAQSLAQWMDVPEAWSLALTQEETAEVRRLLAATCSRCESAGDSVLKDILYDKSWRGTVVFSAGVDLQSLPPELSFLANGIRPERFRALYVAFPAASLLDGETGKAFALIDYHDETHLQYEELHPFGFKVLELRLKIENGAVSEFKGKVELLVNQLFGCRATGYGSDSGNNLVFDGSRQTDESGAYYAFVISKPQSYGLDLCGIQDVTMSSATLHTGENGCRFVLGGTMVLHDHPGMDVLSYDSVPFGGLTVQMEAAGQGYVFAAPEESTAFPPGDRTAREGSLAAGFPVALARLVRAEGKTVAKAGFTPLKISGGAKPEELGTDWRGLLWEIRTGNMGGLAAAVDLTLELLTAWTAPDQTVTDPERRPSDQPLVLCAVRIAGAGGGDDWALPLQGVMSLGFDSVELHLDKKDGSWYFRFRNFSLTILGKRFPETNNDLYLISDGNGGLGWYGAMGG